MAIPNHHSSIYGLTTVLFTVLRGTVRATNNMISFRYSFLSALFGGVIGGFLGAMLTLKIFGVQGQQQADEEDRDGRAPDVRLPRREAVEHDYIPEI